MKFDVETKGSRLDLFLSVQTKRSRSYIKEQLAKGRVKLNGAVTTKAHYDVKPGDVLTLPQGGRVRVVEVLAHAERRGPAAEAERLYAEREG